MPTKRYTRRKKTLDTLDSLDFYEEIEQMDEETAVLSSFESYQSKHNPHSSVVLTRDKGGIVLGGSKGEGQKSSVAPTPTIRPIRIAAKSKRESMAIIVNSENEPENAEWIEKKTSI